jgi:hypothetical protein
VHTIGENKEDSSSTQVTETVKGKGDEKSRVEEKGKEGASAGFWTKESIDSLPRRPSPPPPKRHTHTSKKVDT